MDVIELLKAALFGLVEGLTEWLPISSTGHLLLLGQFVTLSVSPQFWDVFVVVVQLGAILAVCVLFLRELNPFAPSKGRSGRRDTWVLWAKIVVGCIPAALVGIPLDDWMEEHLSGPYVIACALAVYGVAFIVIERWREAKAASLASRSRGAHFAAAAAADTVGATAHALATETSVELADADAPIKSIDQLGFGRVLGIGCFQVLSLVPGTSRSGSTIIGGLLLGCTRTVAAEFTFYLAIPVMFGASALRLAKYLMGGAAPTAMEIATLGVGCAVAFAVSILAIRFLLAFVRRHDFEPFGWYRIALAVCVVAYFALAR